MQFCAVLHCLNFFTFCFLMGVRNMKDLWSRNDVHTSLVVVAVQTGLPSIAIIKCYLQDFLAHL